MKRIELKQNALQINPYEFKSADEYLKEYLENFGIKEEDIHNFLGTPDRDTEDNPYLLDNIEDAVEKVHELCMANAKTFVQVDSDTDGWTSSAVLIQYLKRRFPELPIEYRLHPGKEHGIVPEAIANDVKLVIIPDAGSNNYEEQKNLRDRGITCVILDHHEVHNYEDTGAILVNNQFSNNFSNKYLSGVGIVYMFIKVFDDTYYPNDPIHEDYLDLTAVGIIADAMNMSSLGNNFIAHYGLSSIKNQFLHELAIKQSRGIPDPEHLTKENVSWYIAPVINGVIRSGSPEDKALAYRAMVTPDDHEIYTSEWRGNVRSETLYEYAVRNSANAKSRQDSAKKKSFQWLCTKIEAQGLQNNNLIIVAMNTAESRKVSQNITGLIAMELVKEYHKPCLVLRETEYEGKKVFGGSGRNGNFYGFDDLLEFLRGSGHVLYAEGHANAFGVFIEPDEIDNVIKYANENIDPQIFLDSVYEVDYWWHTYEHLNAPLLMAFAEYDDLWGNGIEKPLFAFDFNFDEEDWVLQGPEKTSIKISKDGVDFVAFKNPILANELKTFKSGHVRAIGSPKINEWLGRKSVRIEMKEIDITPEKEPETRDLRSLI